MVNAFLAAEESKILDWLSCKNFSGPQHSAIKHQTEGTGSWLLKDERYLSWRSSPAGLLWLHGVGMSQVRLLFDVVCVLIIDAQLVVEIRYCGEIYRALYHNSKLTPFTLDSYPGSPKLLQRRIQQTDGILVFSIQ